VRDRVLSLDELRKVLDGFRGRNVSPTARAIVVGMIAMGGARGSEIMRARRDWLRERDGRQWLCLPKTKNGHPHDLPTTAAFREVVKGFEALAGDLDSPYLFPSPHRPDEPLTPTSLAQCVRRWCERARMEPWQPRDLRRTMKTHLVERRPDLERALEVWHNHGTTAGVSRRHNNRATYTPTKVEAAARSARSSRRSHVSKRRETLCRRAIAPRRNRRGLRVCLARSL
jgi:integrase